ncbi:hypothetical protein MTO96_035944 [Rhipicephalus appendiculatus]
MPRRTFSRSLHLQGMRACHPIKNFGTTRANDALLNRIDPEQHAIPQRTQELRRQSLGGAYRAQNAMPDRKVTSRARGLPSPRQS